MFLASYPNSIWGIQFYAICILIGIIIAAILGLGQAKRLGIKSDDVYLGILIIVPLAIIGARLWYVLFNLDKFDNFLEVLGFKNGKFIGLAGLAIQGGVIAALLSLFGYCRWKKISFYKALDLVAPGFLIGQICGRWGNYFNQELYGASIDAEWYKTLISSVLPYMNIAGTVKHPVFLYEGTLNLVCLIFMLVTIYKKTKLSKYIYSGDYIALYLVWYGMVRCFTESLRMNSGVSEPLMFGNSGISVSITISVLFIVAGIALFIIKRFVGPKVKYYDIVDYVKENKIDTIIFDLDGTILDSKELIFNSFLHTFEKYRPDFHPTEDELESYFGPTLYQTFSRYSKDEAEIEEMIAYYREYNVEAHDNVVKLFPGVKDTIKVLHKKGYKLAIVSSKKSDLVHHAIDIFDMNEYIDLILGQGDYDNPKPAPDGIIKACEKLEAKNALYVGDTKSDIIAAHAANVKACGVLYIKHPEIMLEVNPDFVISSFNDILGVCGE